ncbi:hypothetical protein R69658_07994 [Paraburkholderia aspalathi]|uniref:EF-hand domain-containing protein n=1 Tax=Paraburkholderia aspalathi TaxID=1324617 RepID=A0ABM8T8A6_9BURK|nr:hypothetical protein [Paraburkholderia aspalathi]MBK3824226.1 hypothetical protein [Paraburkholderia aspalathi]MBK3836070.1 hypothetical protein [Paraburkholderia aspalathi]MBK3865832.1 hypothetical protein [Paraburkholderia aspalathi]CAE6868261.1 hypothetical protein R69658_07994 [Paraburkholderia aspalathi]
MTVREYTRFQLAENQLEAAIGLFIVGRDRFSVITLAGAADVILSRLALDNSESNFTDTLMQGEIRSGAVARSRVDHGREINDVLFINDMKHMDKDEDGFIDMDPDECAFGAIMKAMVNYIAIVGRKNSLATAFLLWVNKNIDSKKYNVSSDPNWQPEDAQVIPPIEGEKGKRLGWAVSSRARE